VGPDEISQNLHLVRRGARSRLASSGRCLTRDDIDAQQLVPYRQRRRGGVSYGWPDKVNSDRPRLRRRRRSAACHTPGQVQRNAFRAINWAILQSRNVPILRFKRERSSVRAAAGQTSRSLDVPGRVQSTWQTSALARVFHRTVVDHRVEAGARPIADCAVRVCLFARGRLGGSSSAPVVSVGAGLGVLLHLARPVPSPAVEHAE
jgi:hypothetical protein